MEYLDKDKVLSMLELNRFNHKVLAEESADESDDEIMYHSAECTFESIIEVIKTGKYTVEPTK